MVQAPVRLSRSNRRGDLFMQRNGVLYHLNQFLECDIVNVFQVFFNMLYFQKGLA